MLHISCTIKITNQEALRRVHLKKACLLVGIRIDESGLLWPYQQAQHIPTCIIRSENRSQGQTKNYVDGEHNGVVRVWLCDGNNDGTGRELLAANHCNGRNLKSTSVNSQRITAYIASLPSP